MFLKNFLTKNRTYILYVNIIVYRFVMFKNLNTTQEKLYQSIKDPLQASVFLNSTNQMDILQKLKFNFIGLDNTHEFTAYKDIICHAKNPDNILDGAFLYYMNPKKPQTLVIPGVHELQQHEISSISIRMHNNQDIHNIGLFKYFGSQPKLRMN